LATLRIEKEEACYNMLFVVSCGKQAVLSLLTYVN